ncbi:MAG TPA: DNA polymerase IV [Steroidobacteraceae bacterium]|nr:DNA polymerase IV [Steroidobacteraceae bacterium]
MSVPRVVLHVDMDAFYASVEQHDDPRLAGLPVIVGGNGPRGVVAAANYEVRKFGVRSAMPMRQALERCPQAVCVRPRMARYQEVSRVVFAIFNEFTPLVQGLSLDEAFLDVSACREPVAHIAAEIKRRIRARTGLSASVGAATNKLVAKIASDLNKPDGLTLVTPQTLRATLDPLPVRRLPGLGGKTGMRLEAAGIRTLGELRVASDAQLWPIFGRHSPQLRDRAAGLDDRPVMVERQELSISAEDTFDTDIGDPRKLRQAVAELADLACSRTRDRDLAAGCIAIKIREHDFTTFSRQRAVQPATQDRHMIATVATQLLDRWLDEHPGARLRLLGVALRQLTPATQLDLFGAPRGGVDAALDAVRQRFGKQALRRASSLE